MSVKTGLPMPLNNVIKLILKTRRNSTLISCFFFSYRNGYTLQIIFSDGRIPVNRPIYRKKCFCFDGWGKGTKIEKKTIY